MPLTDYEKSALSTLTININAHLGGYEGSRRSTIEQVQEAQGSLFLLSFLSVGLASPIACLLFKRGVRNFELSNLKAGEASHAQSEIIKMYDEAIKPEYKGTYSDCKDKIRDILTQLSFKNSALNGKYHKSHSPNQGLFKSQLFSVVNDCMVLLNKPELPPPYQLENRK